MLPSIQSEIDLPSAATVRCPACHQNTLEIFFEIKQAPILCNILCCTRAEALAVPRGDIRLGFCAACAHVYNAAFDADLMEYDAAYENSLQFSPRFRDYLESVADNLVQQHGLRGKNIIEIGCGQGDFLSLLCWLGNNRGLGFDPSFDAAKADTCLAPGVQIVPEHYSNQHADRPVDLLCCRHVLEHIPQPLEFLKQIRETLGDRSNVSLFFEVPNALFTLDRLAIWDLIYEHCSYFTPTSLRRIFEMAGFEVLSVDEVYDGQFLTIVARPTKQSSPAHLPSTLHLADSVSRFAIEYGEKVAHWRQKRDQLLGRNSRAVVWGAGSKAATFLNVLAIRHDVLPYAVDLNPRKHGHFVAGGGQQIVPPSFLADYRPDTVIVMNAIYRDEIRRDLTDLNVSAEVLSA